MKRNNNLLYSFTRSASAIHLQGVRVSFDIYYLYNKYQMILALLVNEGSKLYVEACNLTPPLISVE